MEFYQTFMLIIVILIGIYLLKITPTPPPGSHVSECPASESVPIKPTKGCPNVLYGKNGKFYLINTNKEKIPGINPVVFDNLEKYITFLGWQRDKGINCPILYAQYSTNAQGEDVIKIKSDPVEPESGTPAGISTAQTSNVQTTKVEATSADNEEYLVGKNEASAATKIINNK